VRDWGQLDVFSTKQNLIGFSCYAALVTSPSSRSAEKFFCYHFLSFV
jgi:hypothetical protein